MMKAQARQNPKRLLIAVTVLALVIQALGGLVTGVGKTYAQPNTTLEKNAYINNSVVAENGTELNPVRVYADDEITYKINFAGFSAEQLPQVATPQFQQPTNAPIPINFVNGGFEAPYVDGDPSLIWGQHPSLPQSGNEPFVYLKQRCPCPHYTCPDTLCADCANGCSCGAEIPGWSTRPTNPSNNSNPWAYYVEIQKPVTTNAISSLYQVYAPFTPDGSLQYGELNAEVPGVLYQVCDTVPGTRVYWELYHAARGNDNWYDFNVDEIRYPTNTDVMDFFLYAAGGQPDANPSSPTYNRQARCTSSTTKQHISKPMTFKWNHFSGYYDVPAGQTLTEFAFMSVSTGEGDPKKGNYLDGVRLYTNSYILLELVSSKYNGTVDIGEVVDYTLIATNTGESDASNVNITQVLPAGMQLVAGSVKVDGVSTNNYVYDPVTNTLSLPIGTTVGNVAGLMRGNGSFSIDCQPSHTITFSTWVTGEEIAANNMFECQSMATYKDRSFENLASHYNYSNVSSISLGQGITLVDQIPVGLTYVSHTAAGASFSISGQTCTWRWNSMPSGSQTVSVTVRIDTDADATFVNTASVVPDGGQPETTNSTYHCFTSMNVTKDAFIGSAPNEQNGTVGSPVRVTQGTSIKYRLTVDVAAATMQSEVANPSSWGQPAAAPQPLNLVNGSFETPVVSNWSLNAWSNQNAANVPGWNVDAGNNIEFGNVTANDNHAPVSADGTTQYVEVIANSNTRLYQTVSVPGGGPIYWEFYHGPRTNVAKNGLYTDIRVPGNNTPLYSKPSTAYNTTPYQWTRSTGSYDVPSNIGTIELSFRANPAEHLGNLSDGNFIDGVRIYGKSHIELMLDNDAASGEVRIGESVTYTITAQNTGQSDASNVVLSFRLPAGMELVSGGVLVDGLSYSSSLYSYDPITRLVTLRIGIGAGPLLGGVMSGADSLSNTPGAEHSISLTTLVTDREVAQNHLYECQVQANYSDRYFEQEAYAHHVNYSAVDELAWDDSFSCIVTDTIPEGLTIVSAPGAAIDALNRKCTWVITEAPVGGTVELIVNTTVSANQTTIFDNVATLTTERFTIESNHTYHIYYHGYFVAFKYVDESGQPLDLDSSLDYEIFVPKSTPNTVVGKTLDAISGYTARGYFVGSSFNPPGDVYEPYTTISVVLVSDTTIFMVYDQTLDFSFIKIDEQDVPLAGADFSIYACSCADDPNHEYHSHLVNGNPGNCWAPLQSTSSGPAGLVSFDRLEAGDYMLVETATLPGYQLPQGQWLIVVDEQLVPQITANGPDPMTLPPAFKTGLNGQLLLPNYPLMTLPYAGGGNALHYQVVGIVLLGSVLIYTILTKKKDVKVR